MTGWKLWAMVAFGGLGAVLAVIYLIGARIPVAHSATASRVVAGTPDDVFDVITDVERLATWRPGVARADRVEPIDGLPAWRESGRTGSMTLQVTSLAPPHRMVTRIADEGLPFGGTWTYELEAAGADSTLVTVTEAGEIYSPIFRFVARYVMGYEGTMSSYLDGLEARMSPSAG